MRIFAIHAAGQASIIARGTAAAALALAVAACGSSSPGAAPAASGTSSTHHPMASHSATAASATFGSDCGMIPATGMGSLHGMSMDPVVTAASHDPLLTTLAREVKAAGLGGELNSMTAVTVFAPANTAFSKLSSHEMSMMHGRAELAKILKYHVVSGSITPAKLASGMTLKTLEGGALKAAKMGAVYEVNNAHVLCGNIRTANATVYIIDKVLVPMH